jgi:hypothetical protein
MRGVRCGRCGMTPTLLAAIACACILLWVLFPPSDPPDPPSDSQLAPTRLLSIGPEGRGPFVALLRGLRVVSQDGHIWRYESTGGFVDTAGTFLGAIEIAQWKLAAERRR